MVGVFDVKHKNIFIQPIVDANGKVLCATAYKVDKWGA